MGSLIEVLKRQEDATRAEADRLRAWIEELAGDLARAEEQASRLGIAREEVAADTVIGPERVHPSAVPVMRFWTERGRAYPCCRSSRYPARSSPEPSPDFPAPDLSLRLAWHNNRENLPGLRDVLYAASA